MIIFLYGPDSYRRLQKLNEIVEVYRGRHHGLSEGRFDLSDEEDFYKLQEFMSNRSMFEASKLVILENPFEVKEIKGLKDILKAENKSQEVTVIISAETKGSANFGFLGKLEEPSRSQEFKKIEGASLTAFIKNEAVKRKLKLSTPTIEALKSVFDGNSWGVITELDKLALSKEQSVETQLVQENFYELVNTLRSSRDIKKRLSALEFILSGLKEDPARAFNTLAYRIFTVDFARQLADYDLAIKSGRLDYEEALLDLALL